VRQLVIKVLNVFRVYILQSPTPSLPPHKKTESFWYLCRKGRGRGL